MTGYLFNLKGDKDKCQQMAKVMDSEISACEASENKAIKKDLTASDYNNIRKSTALLMQLPASPSASDVKKLSESFANNSEDTSYHLLDEPQKTITADRIATLLKKAKWTKSLNGPCLGIKTGIQAQCSFEINVIDKDTVQIIVKNEDAQLVLRDFNATLNETDAYVMEKGDKSSRLLAAYYAGTQSYKLEEGSTQDNLDLILNEDMSKIVGLTIRRKVVATASYNGDCLNLSEATVNAKTLIEDDIRLADSKEILSMKDSILFRGADGTSCKNSLFDN